LLAWLAGEALARATGVPLPGGTVGLFVLLLLLTTRRLELSHVKGADWLLGEMALFFVPAVLAVLDHPEFCGVLLVKVLVVLLGGTAVVMAATAFTVELLLRGEATESP
jgi:holin-like protein